MAERFHGLQVQPRVNHTNPSSLAWAVGDRFWVKAAADLRGARALDRWASVSDVLADAYLAPHVLERIELGGRPALVFEQLDAEPATTEIVRLLPPLLEITSRLHADTALLVGPPTTAASAICDVWVRRLRTDLTILRAASVLPEPKLADTWHRELDDLERLAAAYPMEVASPVHRDLWRANVLVGSNRYWIIDWDGLAVGDPVVDDAVLLFDALGPEPDAWAEVRPPADGSEVERFRLCARLQLLDRVIDPLADHVQLPVGDEWDAVRRTKETESARAWSTYQEVWG